MSDAQIEAARDVVRAALAAADNGNHAGEQAVLRMAASDDLLVLARVVTGLDSRPVSPRAIYELVINALAAVSKATGQ